jgi:Transposase DDE domain
MNIATEYLQCLAFKVIKQRVELLKYFRNMSCILLIISILEVLINQNNDISMHVITRIYGQVKETLLNYAQQNFAFDGNHQFYPKKPLFTDLELISLAITAESLQIDSENYLWSKLQCDYKSDFPNLPHRTKFNKRKKRLADVIMACANILSQKLIKPTDLLIIDSMPISTCCITREKSTRVCQYPNDEVVARKGWHASSKTWYIGYKLHLITTESGVYVDFLVTSANAHDNCFLKKLSTNDHHLRDRVMIGDRGYVGAAIQLSLFEELALDLKVPFRRNQKDFTEYPIDLKIKRKTIETVFSQLCDEFMIKRNYAKSFSGFFARIACKIASKTFKQTWNMKNGNPINQTKHATAA